MHLLICLFTSAYAPMEYSPPPPLLPWLLQLMNGRSPQCLMTLLLPVVSAVLISQLIRCTKLRGMLLYTLSLHSPGALLHITLVGRMRSTPDVYSLISSPIRNYRSSPNIRIATQN